MKLLIFLFLLKLSESTHAVTNPSLVHPELNKCGNFNIVGYVEFDKKTNNQIFIIYSGSLKESEFYIEGDIPFGALGDRNALVRLNVDFKSKIEPRLIFQSLVGRSGKTDSYEKAIELVKEFTCLNKQ